MLKLMQEFIRDPYEQLSIQWPVVNNLIGIDHLYIKSRIWTHL